MFKRAWNWIRPTLEGEDGKASQRRLVVLYGLIALSYMLIKTASGSIFPEIAWIAVTTLTGAFSGMSVWQTLANKKKNENITETHHTEPCNDANCKNPNCINYNPNH